MFQGEFRKTPVAVKRLAEHQRNDAEFEQFLEEAKIMRLQLLYNIVYQPDL